ncbi:hypothetical protein PULV_a1333 [Pseudoalteromonas ulvae UL12]|uniref:hypothetical protein n=1 Tax=Pseudoalteromonas ulvae TaxID=107327 RepID=UPI00186B9DE4|nr:hypothetical protein [Pseudoalteromonas ulvae]MBE0363833.1 hypothetical protein [Pseudoalteromonas ulvae UL12]
MEVVKYHPEHNSTMYSGSKGEYLLYVHVHAPSVGFDVIHELPKHELKSYKKDPESYVSEKAAYMAKYPTSFKTLSDK